MQRIPGLECPTTAEVATLRCAAGMLIGCRLKSPSIRVAKGGGVTKEEFTVERARVLGKSALMGSRDG